MHIYIISSGWPLGTASAIRVALTSSSLMHLNDSCEDTFDWPLRPGIAWATWFDWMQYDMDLDSLSSTRILAMPSLTNEQHRPSSGLTPGVSRALQPIIQNTATGFWVTSPTLEPSASERKSNGNISNINSNTKQPDKIPKWSISNQILVENQWKSSSG